MSLSSLPGVPPICMQGMLLSMGKMFWLLCLVQLQTQGHMPIQLQAAQHGALKGELITLLNSAEALLHKLSN